MDLRSHFDILAPKVNPNELSNRIVDCMYQEGQIINELSSGIFKRNKLLANSYPIKDIRWISLEHSYRKELVIKAFYPASVSGIRSEIRLTKISEDNRGYEANLEADLVKGDTDINFFDPFYSFNSQLYKINETIDFYFSGLAYSLQKSVEREVEVEGVFYRIDGAAIFIPVNDFCDYQYMLAIEELDEIYFENELIYKMRGLVMNHEETDTHFDINLYVSARNIVTENYIPKVGDSVEGLLWLQGYYKAFK